MNYWEPLAKIVSENYSIAMTKFQKLKTLASDITSPRERKLSEQFAFGAREALIFSLGLDTQTLFLAGIQHGYLPNSLAISRPKIYNNWGRLYVDLVWNSRGYEDLRSCGRAAVPIGAPWAHLANRISKDLKGKPEIQVGQVCYFPAHSYHGWETKIDLNVRKLIKNGQKVIVCLYWLDFLNKDLVDSLKNQGFEVVCAGFRGSSGNEIPWADVGNRSTFLLNLWGFISRSEVIICDEVSSALWYSLSLGKPTMVLNKISHFKMWSTSDLKNPQKISQDNEKLLMQNGIKYDFDLRFLNSKGELTELAQRELGWEYVQGVNRLRSILHKYCVKEIRLPEEYVDSFRKKYQQILD